MYTLKNYRKKWIKIKKKKDISCWCNRKKHHICKKFDIWNPATCSCKNDRYLASIIDNSVITCEEITDVDAKSYDEETKTVTTILMKNI